MALLLPDVLEVPVPGRIEEEVVGRCLGSVAVDLVDELDEWAALHHQPLELVIELAPGVEIHLRLRGAEDLVDLRVDHPV